MSDGGSRNDDDRREPHRNLEHLGLGRRRPCPRCVRILEERLAAAIENRDQEGRLMAEMSDAEVDAARRREANRIRAAKWRARKRAAEAS